MNKFLLFLGGDHMANLKSAKKRVNTNLSKRLRNQAVKSDMRTNIKKVEQLIEANDVENAKTAYNKTVQVIDKAVGKGVIRRNNGNRHKAKLAKKVGQATA